MILHINTVDRDKIDVFLELDGQIIDRLLCTGKFGSQTLLPQVAKLVGRNNLEFEDIKSIKVATGPGSFTGLRVGVSVANALGFALHVSVNGKISETELQYQTSDI